MARIATPPVPMKMYRHFAIVTLAITACIALMADGENRQAATEHIEVAVQHEQELLAPEQRSSASQAATPGYGEANFSARSGSGNRRNRTQWDYDEFDEGYGQATDRSGARANSSSRSFDTQSITGYSQAYIDALSEEERQALMASLSAEGVGSPAQIAQNRSAIEAASRRRSGATR